MMESPEPSSTHQTNHAQDAQPKSTTTKLLQQILELRWENELICQRAEEAHRRVEEANAEHAAAR